LGGEIGVDSTIESGSIFTVTLPVQAQKHREIDVALSGTHTLENPDLPMLLLVEDHADVAYYLGRLLSGKYTIVTAKNGEEGLAKAQSLIPDLILSDVMMPKMDGYEMTAQLKSDFRTAHIPIILLTAKSRHEDKIEGLKGGADAYLVKPIAEDELLVRIQKLIETRQKLRDRYAGESLLFPKEVRQDPFLEKALDILENNYHEERFGIGEFASALHLSRMQVHRKLKALTGESASHFINRFRLEKGREILILNHLNVSEVAYACGYSDPGYFGKLFSKAYGESPQHFQNTVQA
jgi:YesN/AraC family two-component response regulator